MTKRQNAQSKSPEKEWCQLNFWGENDVTDEAGLQMRNITEDMKSVTRARAIHLHCYQCNGTHRFETENDCVDPGCNLYPFRPGKGPGRKKSRRGRNPRSTNEE